jgi:hypothetical protein
LIHIHPSPNKLRSFHFKLERHVCPRNYRAPIPKSTPRIYTTFPTSTMTLNSPPLKLYDFVNLALDSIHKFVKGQGYTVITFRSKTDKQLAPTMRKMWLRCAKGNSYKRTARKRLTGSCITDCPFRLILTRTAIRWSETALQNHCFLRTLLPSEPTLQNLTVSRTCSPKPYSLQNLLNATLLRWPWHS